MMRIEMRIEMHSLTRYIVIKDLTSVRTCAARAVLRSGNTCFRLKAQHGIPVWKWS